MTHQCGDPKCAAAGPEGIEGIRRWQEEQLVQHGFYVHFVPDPDRPYVNSHTHGIKEKWGHHDLQLVFPLPQRLVMQILWNVVDRIKAGEKFTTGRDYTKLIGGGFKVRFMECEEAGRTVLRLLLPDSQGRLPGDVGCSEDFDWQIECVPA